MTATPWVDGEDPAVLPPAVRRAFAELAGPLEIRPLAGGLLHESFHVRAGAVEYVLQRVSEVFASGIQDNIQAVTRHLKARGFRCAELLPTSDGQLSAALGDTGRWRLMPHLGGVSFDAVQSIPQVESAGRLVGRFHAALRDFDEELAPLGIPYRDTPVYLAAMRSACASHGAHRLAEPMRAIAERLLARFDSLGAAPEVASRVIHGDLKLTNLLFESAEPPGRDVAFAIVDLDTLMRAPLWVELGDAWRSWCHRPDAEAEARFDLEIFAASLVGFRSGYGASLTADDRDSLAMAPERIALELCARFVTDALEETYFAWDEARYPAAGEHNAARAESQWVLCQALRATRDERAAIVERLA